MDYSDFNRSNETAYEIESVYTGTQKIAFHYRYNHTVYAGSSTHKVYCLDISLW